MNSILIYDLTGHCNSPFNAFGMKLLWLYSSNCMSIAAETKGYRWLSIKKSIRKFLGQRKSTTDPNKEALRSVIRFIFQKQPFKKVFCADDGQKVASSLKASCSLSRLIYGAAGSREEDGSILTTSERFIKTYFTVASTATWLFIS